VLHYHERTKHHRRYADSPDHLDWATQPDPFRTYTGAVPRSTPAGGCAAHAVRRPVRPGAVRPRRLDVNGLAVLLNWRGAVGLEGAPRQPLGTARNPSSGNLHPTEGCVVVPELPGLPPASPPRQPRSSPGAPLLTRHTRRVPSDSFLVGLSSVHWREAWKYGERAYRYCQHDAGHAIATIRYAAAAVGWHTVLLESPSDAEVSALLGLDRNEDFAAVDPLDREHPDCLLLVSAQPITTATLPNGLVESVRRGTWAGRANPLSPAHVRWDAIDVVSTAATKPVTAPTPWVPPPLPSLPRGSATPAATLIRQRRSCLALDGVTSIPAATFFHILDHLLPRPGVPPWGALPWSPHLHPAIFVHRVEGLQPGLYCPGRDAAVHERLRAAMRPAFRWERVDGCPEHLALPAGRERPACARPDGELSPGDRVGRGIQPGDDRGLWRAFGRRVRGDRRLFWESGVLGQVLYLEAEGSGRAAPASAATDDVFHQLLGLQGDAFQSLYHFTIAGVDDRLRTIAPYACATDDDRTEVRGRRRGRG
jgi:nitroreductase